MILVNEPLLNGNEKKYLMECIDTGWVSSAGRFIAEFEKEWARYCGRKHGVAVMNGTVALQAAVAALELSPGDEVIMPSFTIVSCAQAVVYCGGTPVLVDCDPRTWTMDVGQVEAKITPRTKAIMPVHIYGHPVDMDPVLELARRHGLAIIEDAAEAHGAGYLSGRDSDSPVWWRAGSFGLMSCFSFYANKIVTTGEGGMVLTDDDALAERLRLLRNLCFKPGARFQHDTLGFNFRMTNLQAALGLAQTERVDETIKRKREVGAEYTKRLGDVPNIMLPVEEPWARNVYWMYGLVIGEEAGMDAVELARRLDALGVQTRPFFRGMHDQPALQEMGLFRGESYPVTERISRQGIYLPSGTALTDEQIEAVCARVHEVLGQ
jgi:perosamine synthetase